MRVLLGLYALAMLAALAILLRNGSGDQKKTGINPGELLSAARPSGVAWITINGVITHGESNSPWGRGMPSMVRRLRRLAERKDVRAIVLDINSPGGSVGAVQELHSQLLRVRRESKKPVVALLNDIAASGGYYLASGCDAVVAHPGTLLGSIGVIFHTANVEGLLSKIGVRSDNIKSGKMKDIGSSTRPMTKEEHELLQGIIDDAYGQFLHAVSEGRKIPESELKPLADGRIFTGRQALALKLVDELGDSQRALELAGKLGGISGKPEIVRDVPDSLSGFLDMLDSVSSLRLPAEAALFQRLGENFSGAGLEYRWRP